MQLAAGERPEAAAATPLVASNALSPQEEGERRKILEALDRCVGNQTRAAALLGMSRRSLCEKLKVYRIPRPRR